MTVTVQSVVDRVQNILQDTTGIRWPTAELVLWVNDAQREIALIKPDATAVTANVALVVGTKQTIPSDGNRLLSINRNMSSAAGSATGKRAIRLVDSEILNAMNPDWHDPSVTGDAAHTTTVKHYTFDSDNPRVFYVYPGASSTSTFIEIVYSANPATVALSGNLGVPDLFANAVMNYVLYMAYQKDAEVAAHQQRAGTHYQLFTTSVAGKAQLDLAANPNTDRAGSVASV